MEKKEYYLLQIPTKMLKPENVIEFVRSNLKIVERDISIFSKEEIKRNLNSLSVVIFSQGYNEKITYILHILFSYTLILYGQQFNSRETLENVLENLNSEKHKNYFASKFAFQFKFYNAYALFAIFNISIREGNNILTKNELLNLIKSKFYLTKIYIHHVDEKNILNNNQLFDTLNLLSAVLSQLSRWPEALSYLTRLGIDFSQSSEHISYLKGLILAEIKEKTCLDYNGLLLLSIIDECKNGKAVKSILIGEQKKQLEIIEKKARTDCRENKIYLNDLRNHKNKISKNTRKNNQVENFILKNNLYLNEHCFFCSCKSSIGDNLKIETNHLHTKIFWVNDKKAILDDIIADFSLSRLEFFKCQPDSDLTGYYLKSFNKSIDAKNRFKISLLKSSFKRCYSILDKIAISILESLNINYSTAKDEYGNKIDIYFLNMWDLDLIEYDAFRKNQFLHSLYSIAKDLDRTDYSALKEFKSIRNSIEHKILLVSNYDKEIKDGGIHKIPLKKLIKHTEILLLLTKSAIFSFTYFLRRQSKIVEMNS